MIVHARGSPCTACVCVCGSCLAPIQQQDCGLKCCVLRLQPVVGAWLLEHAALAGTYNAGTWAGKDWEGFCVFVTLSSNWQVGSTGLRVTFLVIIRMRHTLRPNRSHQHIAALICGQSVLRQLAALRRPLELACCTLHCEKQPHSFLLLEAVVVIL